MGRSRAVAFGLVSMALLMVGGCEGTESVSDAFPDNTAASASVTYRNPQVMKVDYSFELVPDPATIDRAHDLKRWIPVPREWESQKAVRILSVDRPPDAEYQDPEHGNRR